MMPTSTISGYDIVMIILILIALFIAMHGPDDHDRRRW